MAQFRVGVQFPPEQCTIDQLRHAWREADAAGFDSIWTWDHFFALHGDPDGPHLESWSLMAVMASDTSKATIGTLVTCNSYRNPDLLADMARVVDHVSGGRLVLGLGSGWNERDYREYGYELGDVSSRLSDLEAALPRIKRRLASLNPPPVGKLPILLGGVGERTLRLVAEHAQIWNGQGKPTDYRLKNEALDRWCEKVGRSPGEIERTVLIWPEQIDDWPEDVAARAEHIIVQVGAPFDLTTARKLIEFAAG